MAIEYRHRNRTTKRVVMLSCPFCGHEFTPHESRPQHFRREHGPDDLARPSGGASGFVAWAARHGVDVEGARDARMTLRMGGVEDVEHAVKVGFRVWEEAGMDPTVPPRRVISRTAVTRTRHDAGRHSHGTVPVAAVGDE